MRIKVTISRTDLKENAFLKARKRKLESTNIDKSNPALVNNLIYNMMLKERNKKCKQEFSTVDFQAKCKMKRA